MAEGIQGDATPEDADKQLLKDMKARLASASGSNPVTLTGDQARRLYEMAGGSMEPDEVDEDANDPSKKAHVGAPSQYPEAHLTAAQRAGVAPAEAGATPEKPQAQSQSQQPAAQQAAAQQGGAKKTRQQLNDMTKEELVEYADDHDIDVTPSWSKADIVEAIAKHK